MSAGVVASAAVPVAGYSVGIASGSITFPRPNIVPDTVAVVDPCVTAKAAGRLRSA